MTNLDTEPAPLPPPTAAPEPPERRWARSADDRVVLGVAGGLGRALAIEPIVVRIAFVALALFGGVGIVLYIAGLALLADSPTAPPASTPRRVVGVVVGLLAARWLFSGDADLPDAGWVVAIGLLAVAVALWRGRTPVDVHTLAPQADVTTNEGGSTGDRWGSWTAQRRDRPRPPRSALGLLTIGAATVVGTLVWLLNESADSRGAWSFGWATVILGAGLVVGAFAGRARWLIIPAMATAVAAVAASAMSFAGVGFAERSGNRTLYIGPGNSVATHYETGMGNFDLILADYPSDLATSVDVGVGKLTVVVPDNARVQIDARVGIGSIDAFGTSRSGYRRILTLDDQPDGAHLIALKLRVGVGEIEVRRGSFDDIVPFPTPPTFLPEIPVRRLFGDGTTLFGDGSIDFGDGWRIEADGSYQIPIIEQRADGSVQLDNGAVIRADGTVQSPGGFVIVRIGGEAPVLTIAPSTTEDQP